MEKFVSYDKLSKKEKKKLDSAKRRDWQGLNPVTRVADENKKAYKRKLKHPIKLIEE
ncbi:MAG: hypothetical protein IKW87_09820 [Ruminococcus sp.]|nr:hypothetical protein [Ruminococcus sp.]